MWAKCSFMRLINTDVVTLFIFTLCHNKLFIFRKGNLNQPKLKDIVVVPCVSCVFLRKQQLVLRKQEYLHQAVSSIYVTNLTRSFLWKPKLASEALPAVSHSVQTRGNHTITPFFCLFVLGIRRMIRLLLLNYRQKALETKNNFPFPHLKASNVAISSRILFLTQRLGLLPLWPMI